MASPVVNFIASSSILVTGNIMVKNVHSFENRANNPDPQYNYDL